MYRSILVPLDGSPFAEQALPLALSIAKRSGAALQLVFVHGALDVVHHEHRLLSEESWATEWKTHHRAYLDNLVDRLRAAGSVAVTPVVLEGDVPTTIHHHVVKEQVKLVVMTTHARGPVARMWLGSVADQLVRELPIPILLVRPAEAPGAITQDIEFKHILLPLDGTPLAEQIIEPAVALGELMSSPDFTLLRVIQPLLATPTKEWPATMAERLLKVGQEVRDQAQDYLDAVALRLRERLLRVRTLVAEEEQPAVAVIESAEKVRADLIAMQTHGRRGLSRLMLGSVADKVLRGAHAPLLLQKPTGSA